jgi:O-succinylbenzoic acid--CoA ligase
LDVREGFDLHEFPTEGVAFTSLVPTMLVRLLDARVDLSGFKAILLGGARITDDLLRRAAEAGATVVTTYGMTETCGGVVYDGIPLEGVSFELSTAGTVRLSGPTLMTRYRGQAEETSVNGGWFETNDRGRVGEDGRLEVVGRIDDVIVTGGENVDPAEVEAVLERHPAVREALVTGEPSDEWGERVVAQVVAGDSLDVDELKRFVSERLAAHKVPKEFSVVGDLPRLPSGKVKRR